MDSALRQAVEASLRTAGANASIQSVRGVGGGDINHAAHLTTAAGSYFIKWHHNPPPRFFECEADSLRHLALHGARVPGVVTTGGVQSSPTRFLIMEWIEPGRQSGGAAEQLGHLLATLHQQTAEEYGFTADNYIGRLPQPNPAESSWITFYGQHRLGAQRDQARTNGRLPADRERRLNTLVEHLPGFINEADCHPSPLHGDLWSGNWMTASDGGPVLIDPAAYHGDREADLAMTRLFGGFPATFYAAYDDAWPPAPGWQDRVDLYQLYYLLVHLNLFGESYGGSVDHILRRYVG